MAAEVALMRSEQLLVWGQWMLWWGIPTIFPFPMGWEFPFPSSLLPFTCAADLQVLKYDFTEFPLRILLSSLKIKNLAYEYITAEEWYFIFLVSFRTLILKKKFHFPEFSCIKYHKTLYKFPLLILWPKFYWGFKSLLNSYIQYFSYSDANFFSNYFTGNICVQ